jgi:hypothetical protein
MKKSLLMVPAAALALALVLAQGGCAGRSAAVKGEGADAGFVKISGKVVETADAGGYTYVWLEKDGKRTWVAAPPMKVKVGDELDLLPGTEMNNFHSNAMDRTFEKIIFSGGVVPVPGQAAAAKPAKGKEAPPPAVLAGKVIETMDAKGYTYILLEKDGKQGWSAVPATSVKVGEELELVPGNDMGQFTSSALHRTFESIHFSGGVKGTGEDKYRAGKGKADTGVNLAADPAPEAPAQAAAAAPAGMPAGMPAGHPPMPAQTGTPAKSEKPAPQPISGKVVETMDAGGYSYVSLEKDGKKTWVAAPPMQAKKGEELTFQPGFEMSNFTSKTLNRTFDKIIFTNGLAR